MSEDKAVVAAFCFVILANLAWWGFLIWATLRLLQHFGVV